MSDNLKEKELVRDIAVGMNDSNLNVLSGVVEAKDGNGEPIFLAVVAGVEAFESLEDATEFVQMVDEESEDEIPSDATIQ